jgi:hypothetical protein
MVDMVASTRGTTVSTWAAVATNAVAASMAVVVSKGAGDIKAVASMGCVAARTRVLFMVGMDMEFLGARKVMLPMLIWVEVETIPRESLAARQGWVMAIIKIIGVELIIFNELLTTTMAVIFCMAFSRDGMWRVVEAFSIVLVTMGLERKHGVVLMLIY